MFGEPSHISNDFAPKRAGSGEDAVVAFSARIYRCTGVLLTGNVVLTSQECVRRSDGKGTVYIGDRTSFEQSEPWRKFPWSRSASYRPAGDTLSAGLAIVFLDENAAFVRPDDNGEARSTFELASFRRPSFQRPTTGREAAVPKSGVAAWGVTDSNESSFEFRQRADFANTVLYERGPFWMAGGARTRGLALGDEGAPLFITRSDGTRDPFALASLIRRNFPGDIVRDVPGCENQDECDGFVDITRSDIRTWIETTLTKRPSARWLAMHPPSGRRVDAQAPGWWVGEVDYTGACNEGLDADCDHIVDFNDTERRVPRDNCIVPRNAEGTYGFSAFNPTQIDSDDDGVGDACDGADVLITCGIGAKPTRISKTAHAAWIAAGGGAGRLGCPTGTTENDKSRGRITRFERGAVVDVHVNSSRSRVERTVVLEKTASLWLANGLPHGTYGYPVASEITSGDGSRARVETDTDQVVFWSSAQGAAFGPVLSRSKGVYRRYVELGGFNSGLVAPIESEASFGAGSGARFERSHALYAAPGSNAFLVKGMILSEYVGQGGPMGTYRFPMADEQCAHGPDSWGCYSKFEGGGIFYRDYNPWGTIAVPDPNVVAIWERSGGAANVGWPVRSFLWVGAPIRETIFRNRMNGGGYLGLWYGPSSGVCSWATLPPFHTDTASPPAPAGLTCP